MSPAEYGGTAPDQGMFETGFSDPTPTPTPTPANTPGPTATNTLTPVATNTPTASSTPAPVTTIDVQIETSSDDAEQSESGGVSFNSSDLELVETSGGSQTVGIRFRNVAIPAGATISSATIQFQVDESTSGSIELTVKGQADDDAPTFDNVNNDISARPTTDAAMDWSPPDWSNVAAAGTDQRTPDIAAVIQEIVGRSGWSSGNSLIVIISGTGKRTAEAYDGDSAGAPVLHVEFVAP